MENDKKPYEIIIKEDGEIKHMVKTNCLLAVVNDTDNVARSQQILLSRSNGFDVLKIILSAQRPIDMQCEKHEELKIFKSLQKLLKEDQE